jgi:hypothetical protein
MVASGTEPVRAVTTVRPLASFASAIAGGVTGTSAPGDGGAWRWPSSARALAGRVAGGTEAKVGIGAGLVQASAAPAGRLLSSR